MLKSILITCCLCLSLMFLSCSEEQITSPDLNYIQGKWIQFNKFQKAQDYTERVIYNFDVSNNTFELKRIVLDSNDSLLGYRFIGQGNFKIKGDNLTINTTKIFTINQQPEPLYVSKDDLEEDIVNYSVTPKFSFYFNMMVWKYPPCPPNADCIGSQIFVREKFRENKILF